jgi:hypothetical protein
MFDKRSKCSCLMPHTVINILLLLELRKCHVGKTEPVIRAAGRQHQSCCISGVVLDLIGLKR